MSKGGWGDKVRYESGASKQIPHPVMIGMTGMTSRKNSPDAGSLTPGSTLSAIICFSSSSCFCSSVSPASPHSALSPGKVGTDLRGGYGDAQTVMPVNAVMVVGNSTQNSF